jgi:rubrerythrin
MNESDRWLLSFYRASETQGALFFGRLARILRDERVVADMTRHFADEARHAHLWTACLGELGASPLQLGRAYQDAYLEAAGLPASLMEVLALTHVFERRVMRQYAEHARRPGLAPPVARTLALIMEDERRHVRWVGDALNRLRAEFGAEPVDTALARFERADAEVHDEALARWRHELAEVSP